LIGWLTEQMFESIISPFLKTVCCHGHL